MGHKAIRAMGLNVLLLVAIYFGAWQQIDWIAWLAVAFIWFMCAMYFVVLFSNNPPSSTEDPFPPGAGWLMDAIAIYMLVHADWYVTATAYAMSALALESIYRRRGSVE
jgi:hypothetical protein